MASGPAAAPGVHPAGLKFFLYAAEVGDFLLGSDGPYYLAQVVMTAGSGEVTATVKSTNPRPDAGQAFLALLRASLAPLGAR